MGNVCQVPPNRAPCPRRLFAHPSEPRAPARSHAARPPSPPPRRCGGRSPLRPPPPRALRGVADDTRAPGGRRGSGRRRRARRPFSRGSRSRPSARPSTRRERAPLAPPCPHAPRRRPNDPAGSCAALTPRARPGAGLRVRDQVDHARRAGAAPPRARVGPARARVVLGSGRGAERRAARADGDAGRGGRGGRGGHGEHVQRTPFSSTRPDSVPPRSAAPAQALTRRASSLARARRAAGRGVRGARGAGGYRYGSNKLVDALVVDGLWDPYGDYHMGPPLARPLIHLRSLRVALDLPAPRGGGRGCARAGRGAWLRNQTAPRVERGRGGARGLRGGARGRLQASARRSAPRTTASRARRWTSTAGSRTRARRAR